MRTSVISLSVLALSVVVPSTALADGEQTQVAPRVITSDGGGYITPTAVPYEGGEIPANAKIVSKPRIPVVGTGIGLFAASYAGALIYGLSTCSAQETCRPGSGFLYLPFIGPFITAATAPTTGGSALAAFDGGVQVLGAALAIAGFVWPQKFVMWQSKSGTSALKLTPTGGGMATTPAMLGDNKNPGFSAGVALTLTHL
jgi:hypothetical protein